MFRVIIVEDDPMVASINRKYAEASEGFRVDAVFKGGADALEYLKDHTADLVILDYYTPQMNGEEFLDRMHAEGHTPSVIMVTSANNTEIVDRLLKRGVRDYLVKPFEYERFRASLERFRASREMLGNGSPSLDQKDIDRLFTMRKAEEPAAPEELPKGMNQHTLLKVREWLSENRDESFSSEQIAASVGLSRITIRRYVSYLAERGELESRIDYKTGGRPGILYRYGGS